MVLPVNRDFLENLVFQENQDWQVLLGKEANQDPQAYQELENQEKTASGVNLGTLEGKENQDLLAYRAPQGCQDMASQGFQDLKVIRVMQVFTDHQDLKEIREMEGCLGSLVPMALMEFQALQV